MSSSPWLLRRLAGITGTDIAAILGKHPYKTAFDVWASKTGRAEALDLSDSEPVFWGNVLEPVVASEFARRTGRSFVSPQDWATDGRKALTLDHDGTDKHMVEIIKSPIHVVTPDGHIQAWKPLPWLESQEAQEGPGTLEIKTTAAWLKSDWVDGAPEYHKFQSGYNAAVAGHSWFSLAGLVGGQELLTYDYGVDDDTAAWLLDVAAKFWTDHVLGDREPAPVAADAKQWGNVHPKDDGSSIELDAVYFASLDERREELRAQAKKIDSELSEINMSIKAALGDSTTGVAPGVAQYTLKQQHRKESVTAASSFRVLRRKSLKPKESK